MRRNNDPKQVEVTSVVMGTVASAWFSGGRWRVRVSFDAGFVVAVADSDPGEAETVWVTLPPDRCRLLDPEEAAGASLSS